MSAGSAIQAILSTDSVLAPIIGSRVYPAGAVPDNATRPYVEYAIASATPNHNMAGVINDYLAAIMLTITADTYKAAQSILDRLGPCMDAVSGTLGGVNVVIGELGEFADASEVPVESDESQAFEAHATVLLVYS